MKRLLCYAHFDEQGEVKAFVRHALGAMTSVCSTLVFVSNSSISEADRALLGKTCKHVVEKDNVGYDFHMWKRALELESPAEYDEVVLMNSSIYGPILPISDVFEKMDAVQCDFWGITECFQMRPHVQSYFLVFRKQIISSQAFAAFWQGVLPYVNKSQIIMSYEVGLTQWLVDSGFKFSVYSDIFKLAAFVQRIGKRVRLKDNQTIKHPRESLLIGNPFLKREVVRVQPQTMRSISNILRDNRYPESYLQENCVESASICPVCGANGRKCYKKVRDRINPYDVNRYSYFKCKSRDCRVLWTPRSGQLSTDILSTPFYSVNHEDGLENLHAEKKTLLGKMALGGLNALAGWFGIHRARTGFDLLELDRAAPGKLLAVGCDDAGRLMKIRNLGWQVTSLTIEDVVSTRSKDKADEELQRQFDVVFLPDVIAQLADVKEFLAACNGLLKPGGMLYLSSPNANSLTHALFRKFWFGIDPSSHFIVYTPEALKRILSDASFSNIKVKTVYCQTEKYVLHSVDILLNKWTWLVSGPRLGQEVMPLLLQLVFWLGNLFSGSRGDECLAVATKRSSIGEEVA